MPFSDPQAQQQQQDRRRFELLEQARVERVERAYRKQLELAAIRAQAIVRGIQSRRRLRVQLAGEITNSLADIAKVQQLVVLSTKKRFVLPIKPANRLALCFGHLIATPQQPAGVKSALVGLFPKFALLLADTLQANPPSSELRWRRLIERELCHQGTPSVLVGPSGVESAPLSEALFSNPPYRAYIVGLMLTSATCQAKLIANSGSGGDLALALFHPCLFSVPGFFSSNTDRRLRVRAHADMLAILTALSRNDDQADDDADSSRCVAQFGNLLAVQFPVDPPPSVSSSASVPIAQLLLWQLLAEFIARRLPQHALAGSEGVGWAKNRVVHVPPQVWRQIDLYLPTTLQRMCGSRLLQPSADLDLARQARDAEAWDKTSAAESPFASSSSSSSSRFNLLASTASSWAKRLMSGGGGDKAAAAPQPSSSSSSPAAAAAGPLRNITHESRLLATTTQLFSHAEAWALLTQLLQGLFLRWPPSTANPVSFAALNTCAFSNARFVDWLWLYIETEVLGPRRATSSTVVTESGDAYWQASFALCIVGTHVLLVTDESELFAGRVMARAALERCVTRLNHALYALDFGAAAATSTSAFAEAYVKRCVWFLSLLRDMHSRRALTREQAWAFPSTATAAAAASSASSSSFFHRFRQSTLELVGLGGAGAVELTPHERFCFRECHMFWCLPFDRKAQMFVHQLATERVVHQPPDEPPQYKLKVRRRDAGLKEALPFFLRSDLRKRVYVVFENDFGAVEAGIDARGLFKEFIQTLAERVFACDGDARTALFAQAMDGDQGLFPNPRRCGTSNSNNVEQYTFAGKVLGKALFEGIVVQPQFSLFLLAKLLGKLVSIGDLASLDAELFKNLLFLKTTELDVADLELTFTTSSSSSSSGAEVELFPGGASVPVTNLSKFRYVNHVAHYKLNVEGKQEHDAFIAGFYSVIRREWIEHFSERELQMLISGKRGSVDVREWRAHAQYAGGYFASSQPVVWFWELVENDFSDQERELLLRFATACSRAPLLGFASLEPRFQIQRVSAEGLPLPTSSTCFNTLKLPCYASKQVMRTKLLQAIKSGAGFELS